VHGEKELYKDYTPNQAVDAIENRTGIKIGRNILYRILRMQDIIDYNNEIIDKSNYEKYFYVKNIPLAKISYLPQYFANKLFTTPDGIDFICKTLKKWFTEYEEKYRQKG
jgi:hypothetical protein